MTDLLTRLEQATEGSRELDALICADIEDREIRETFGQDGRTILGKSREAPYDECILWNEKRDYNLKRYTTSLDAALTLVPEGDGNWPWWNVKSPNPNCPYLKGYHGGAYAQIWLTFSDCHHGHAPTPALALCIAALRARG